MLFKVKVDLVIAGVTISSVIDYDEYLCRFSFCNGLISNCVIHHNQAKMIHVVEDWDIGPPWEYDLSGMGKESERYDPYDISMGLPPS